MDDHIGLIVASIGVLLICGLLVCAAVDVRLQKVNACRSHGYTDLIRWDGVLYCVSIGDTSDVIDGMKYELVIERNGGE